MEILFEGDTLRDNAKSKEEKNAKKEQKKDPVMREKFDKVLRNLKNEKAVGVDGIQVEL